MIVIFLFCVFSPVLFTLKTDSSKTMNKEAYSINDKEQLDLVDDASCEEACLVHELSSWSHRRGERSTRGRLKTHPPVKTSFVPVSRQSLPFKLGVDGKVVVRLLTCFWKSPPLHSELLCHCSDVIRLESTAAPNVANAEVISLPCPFPSLPSCDLSWLH